MKNFVGVLFIFVSVGVISFFIGDCVNANYNYTKDIAVNWNLADKASTIEQKSEYMDKFVIALQASGLQGTNAKLYFQTADSSFDSNFQALQSLQSRLNTIKTMDENSFQYQTAVQQITEQEQGQADDMLSIFQSCYNRTHYYAIWNMWTVLLMIFGSIGLGIIGIVVLSIDEDEDDY